MPAAHSNTKEITYNDQAKVRLDRFLTASFEKEGYTRSFWTNMLEAQNIQLNGEFVKPGTKLRTGDIITIEWPLVDRSYANKVAVIHEDEDILVINKPAGMLSHSKGDFNPEYTVANFAAEHITDKQLMEQDGERSGIVHRLDRLTSGVMIVAKTLEAQSSLQKQFSERTVHKHYVAIVTGDDVDSLPDSIDMPIQRDPAKPKQMRAHNDGKPAKTELVVRLPEVTTHTTTLLLKPLTGRTHQLRVHLATIGRPIIGDELYGSDATAERFLLHAYRLEVTHPTSRERMSFVAPIPDDVSQYLSDETRDTIIQQFDSRAR